MHPFTTFEERAVIAALGHYIGYIERNGKDKLDGFLMSNGSSRLVFDLACDDKIVVDLKNYIQDICGIHPACDLVLKVNVGEEGNTQTNSEFEAYSRYEGCLIDAPLARVFGYGVFIEVMERVESLFNESDILCNIRELGTDRPWFEMLNKFFKPRYESSFAALQDGGEISQFCLTKENAPFFVKKDGVPLLVSANEIEQMSKYYLLKMCGERKGLSEIMEKMYKSVALNKRIYEVSEQLGEVFGDTGDNDQLGVNRQGEVVCFDYGMRVGAASVVFGDHKITGFLVDDIVNNDICDYLGILMCLLENTKDLNAAEPPFSPLRYEKHKLAVEEWNRYYHTCEDAE